MQYPKQPVNTLSKTVLKSFGKLSENTDIVNCLPSQIFLQTKSLFTTKAAHDMLQRAYLSTTKHVIIIRVNAISLLMMNAISLLYTLQNSQFINLSILYIALLILELLMSNIILLSNSFFGLH